LAPALVVCTESYKNLALENQFLPEIGAWWKVKMLLSPANFKAQGKWVSVKLLRKA
jgi:hypothetical protein